MPWSIFTQGGGTGAAVTWAKDLLAKIGAPDSAGNRQFVYDWETSEGGGGAYNPLNQGPVPNHPELTTSGSQYGGGAADFAGWDAGLTGAADYLSMSAYSGILSGLKGNDPASARAALIASPWAASHYGNGADFSGAALPGAASALPPDSSGSSPTPGSSSTATTTSILDPSSWISGLTNSLHKDLLEGVALLAGAGLVALGVARATGITSKARDAATDAAPIAAAAAL